MKQRPLILALSVAANVVLAAVLWQRVEKSSRAAAANDRAPSPAGPTTSHAATKDHAALQAALASGDPAALTAAGVPAEAIRAIVIGRAFDAFQARLRAARPEQADERYWRPAPPDYTISREQRLESSKAEREFSEAIRKVYGEDLESLFDSRRQAHSVLAAEKREQLRQIERDYAEMEQQIYADQSMGIQLPADRDKLKLLRAEKERDIAAMLTPAEREQMALRDSNAARMVKSRFGEVLQTEEEYKKAFALQKAFDDRFNAPDRPAGPPSPEEQRLRREAENKLLDDFQALLGAENWAAAQRANDQDVRMLAGLSRRLSLPAAVTDAVLATRESYAAQSMRINTDPALSATERQTQLRALATTAQAELTATLGSEGGPAFAQRASWITALKNGRAFSLNAADAGPEFTRQVGTGTYPVAPKAESPPRK